MLLFILGCKCACTCRWWQLNMSYGQFNAHVYCVLYVIYCTLIVQYMYTVQYGAVWFGYNCVWIYRTSASRRMSSAILWRQLQLEIWMRLLYMTVSLSSHHICTWIERGNDWVTRQRNDFDLGVWVSCTTFVVFCGGIGLWTQSLWYTSSVVCLGSSVSVFISWAHLVHLGIV